MRNIRYAAALALACLLPTGATAQVGSFRVSISAPTAASLGKFGDVPVSLSSGLPDVSVPLFTMKGKTLELPIVLRYHGGGVRVEEIGSWVGLGWALDAGGTITRSVRGLVDESSSGYYHTGHTFYTNWTSNEQSIMDQLRNGTLDGEPDDFFFNFAGRSGRFVMGPTNASGSVKEVRAIPHQKLRIEPTGAPSGEITSWLITTEDGMQYTFAAKETTTDWTLTPSFGFPPNYGDTYNATWHLTKIKAAGGDSITLHYSTFGTRHVHGSSTERFDLRQGEYCPGPNEYQSTPDYQVQAQRLDSIRSTVHTVVFTQGATLREDARTPDGYQQEPRLDSVTVKTPSGKIVRRFKLEHDYFAGIGTDHGRLRLKNVFEQDSVGASLPPWTFDYDGQTLPPVNSKAQDHWGFYNGVPNTTLIPAMTYATYSFEGADRKPNATLMTIGSLTKITYPTGGSIELVWEANDYGAIGSSDAIYDLGPVKTAHVSSSGGGLNSTTFTIGGTGTAAVQINVQVYPDPGCTPPQIADCTQYGEIAGQGWYNYSTIQTHTLASGTSYTLNAYTDQPDGVVSVTATWRERVAVTRKTAGGLRIAEVRTSDGMGSGPQVRRYRYRLESDTARSSGVVLAEPLYAYQYTAPGCSYFSRTSMSKMPLGGGAPVSYREVTVLHGSNGEFGRTRETFRSAWEQSDGVLGANAWPASRVTSYAWKRGQRLEKTERNASNLPQLTERFVHTFADADTMTTRMFPGVSFNEFSAGMFGTYYYNSFDVIAAWTYQSADSTITYDEAGTSSIVTARMYAFENPAHIQLTRLTETNSNGTKRITRMKYPMDYADGSGNSEAIGITAMKTDSVHIHSPVIERWVSDSVSGSWRVVKAEITTYRTYTGRPLPWQHHILKSASPVTNFVPSTVSGSFTKDSRYLYLDNAADYDAAGRLTFHTDRWGYATNYSYGGTPYSAYLGRIRRCAVASTCNIANPAGGLIQHALYDTLGNMTALRDSLSYRRFAYDSFGRLTQIKNHGNTAVQGYGYTYSRTAPNWTFNASNPNAVVDTTYLQHTPTPLRVVRWTYLDGLGRSIQTVVQDGSTYIVTAQQYDALGREWRKWKPYPRTVPGYDPNFATAATDWYSQYHGVSATPYVETQYAADALNRVKRIRHEFLATPGPDSVQHAYGVESNQSFTEVADEVGMKTRSYRDGWGNEVKTVLGYGGSMASTTLFTHNVLGQRTQFTDPRNLITSFTYNTQGHQSARTSPDAGTTSRLYDATDKLRYSQDANQAAAGQVYFTNYDYGYRPLTSGQGTATFASLDPNAATPPALETNTVNWLTVRAYDAKPSTTAFPWSLFSTQINGVTLSNVYGRLAATANKSNGAWQVQLFSYDTDGRVATRHTFTQANGGGSVLTALNDSVTYTRDLRDAVTVRRLAVGSNTWYQWYDYDNRGLLWKVFASTSATKPGTPDVTYTYRPSGSVQSRQFQGGSLVTMSYNIREQLERIGTVEGGVEPFAARYFYRPDATVDSADFRSDGAPTTQKRYRYGHTYDARKRLYSAQFSPFNGGWGLTTAYALDGMTYDLSGNLQFLARNRADATTVDYLTYTTPTGSNRLTTLAEQVGTSPEAWDAEAGSFTYDANGNMLTSPAPYSISSATYDHQNLPVSFTRSGVTTSYRYNADGQRITKQVGTGNTEVYILDGRTTFAVYTVGAGGTPIGWHHNIVVTDRVVGRQALSVKRYYHTDMLGSTRAVVENGAIVESYDYDPWGVLLEGRTLAGPTKEGFTGKERDAETGLDYFGFRYYMSAFGRWPSVDPLSEKHPEWSPYNYVLDNPLVLVDPDGRQIRADLGDMNPFGPYGDYRMRDGRVERRADYHEAQAKGALLGLSLLPLSRVAGGVAATIGDVATGNFTFSGTLLNFALGGKGKVADEAGGAARAVSSAGEAAKGEAGRFADLVERGVKGDKLTPHHMPQAAAGFTSRADGGALMMPEAEHILTRTYGFKGAMTAQREAGMAFRDVLARDIRDVRSIGGSQYNQGLRDLLDYYRTNFPELMIKK